MPELPGDCGTRPALGSAKRRDQRPNLVSLNRAPSRATHEPAPARTESVKKLAPLARAGVSDLLVGGGGRCCIQGNWHEPVATSDLLVPRFAGCGGGSVAGLGLAFRSHVFLRTGTNRATGALCNL